MRCFGFDSQKAYINRNLKRYGYEYYAARNCNGVLCVYRKHKRMAVAAEWDNFRLIDLIDSPEFVCALTDNWRTNGVPREWGADIVLSRLKDTDLRDDPHLIEKMDEANERVRQTRAKDFRNMTESCLLESKSALQKAFSGINTSTLSKREETKRKRDNRRLLHGNS